MVAQHGIIADVYSPFGAAPPQYDAYGRRKYTNSPAYGTRTDAPASAVPQPPQDVYGAANPGYVPQGRGDPNYGRERQQPAPAAGDRDRDQRRRRLH